MIAPRKVFGSLGFETSIDNTTTKITVFLGWEFPRNLISFTPNMGSYELWAQSLTTDILKVHHRLGVLTRLDACQKSSKHNLHPKWCGDFHAGEAQYGIPIRKKKHHLRKTNPSG